MKFSKLELIRLTINRFVIVIILAIMLFYFGKSLLIQIYNLVPYKAALSDNDLNNISIDTESDYKIKGSNFYNYSTLIPYGCYQLDLRYIYYINLIFYKDVSATAENNVQNRYSRNLGFLDSKYMIFQTDSGKKIIVRANKNENKSGIYPVVVRSFPFNLLIAIKEKLNIKDYSLIEKQYYFDSKIIFSFVDIGGIFINFLISAILILMILIICSKYTSRVKYPLYSSLLQYNDEMNLEEKLLLLNNEMDKYKTWKRNLLKKIYTDKLIVERGIINTKVSNK